MDTKLILRLVGISDGEIRLVIRNLSGVDITDKMALFPVQTVIGGTVSWIVRQGGDSLYRLYFERGSFCFTTPQSYLLRSNETISASDLLEGRISPEDGGELRDLITLKILFLDGEKRIEGWKVPPGRPLRLAVCNPYNLEINANIALGEKVIAVDLPRNSVWSVGEFIFEEGTSVLNVSARRAYSPDLPVNCTIEIQVEEFSIPTYSAQGFRVDVVGLGNAHLCIRRGWEVADFMIYFSEGGWNIYPSQGLKSLRGPFRMYFTQEGTCYTTSTSFFLGEGLERVFLNTETMITGVAPQGPGIGLRDEFLSTPTRMIDMLSNELIPWGTCVAPGTMMGIVITNPYDVERRVSLSLKNVQGEEVTLYQGKKVHDFPENSTWCMCVIEAREDVILELMTSQPHKRGSKMSTAKLFMRVSREA